MTAALLSALAFLAGCATWDIARMWRAHRRERREDFDRWIGGSD